MENNKVQDAVYVRVDDWEGLYLDGKLYSENNSLNLGYELDGKTVRFSYRGYKEADENYTDNVGNFPATFDELLDNEHMWDEDNKDYEDDDED